MLLLLPACGGGGSGDGGADTDSDSDTSSGSESETSGSPCGDGEVEPGEACDGGTAACSDLAASWESGNATCRNDCRGWDVSSCALASSDGWESVKPAVRDPARWEGARCNDGTPFTMSVRLSDERSTEWVIYLQGGLYCDDN